MLTMLFQNGPHVYMPIEDAQKFDQRPFRSMLIQGWAAYKPGKGFSITPKGVAAYQEFETTNIERVNPSKPLTRYFDFLAYGLSDPYKRKKRLHVVHRGAA
jgi:hypothetical protein